MEILKFILCIVLCEFAGIIGGLFTRTSVNSWYNLLNKPSINPPNWVFAPVWSILYFVMGISVYLVWKKGLEFKEVKYALIIFIAQLIFNTSWSFVFFGLRSISGGLIVIIILWVLIFFTIISFYHLNRISAYILIPYILWVTYATLLNFGYWKLN